MVVPIVPSTINGHDASNQMRVMVNNVYAAIAVLDSYAIAMKLSSTATAKEYHNISGRSKEMT
jgi:hypothetical protein